MATSSALPSANTGDTAVGPVSPPRRLRNACCSSGPGGFTVPAPAVQPVASEPPITAAVQAETSEFQFVIVPGLPAVRDDAEGLCVRHAEGPPRLAQTLLDEGVDVAIADLALVTVERRHLLVERLCDVDGSRLDGRAHQPGLLAVPPRLQSLVEQLRKDGRRGAAGHRDVERC